ncbi:MAG: hypothetical protein RJA35_205 [Actinomycetota bacterium]|jgi:4-amino-4-deoxy-L-arabinose transferase-like glycosyltransferase
MKRWQSLSWASGLAALIALTAFNVFYNLQHAERSGYYAMVATSMSRSWHNAFFGAADPSGLLALDKIPGSYWIPAILVHLIGFHNASVVAPNGVATVIAVIMMSLAGRRIGGIWVGLLSGLLFACTPIVIAVARSNEPESAFLLSMSLTAYFITVALKWRTRLGLTLAGLAIALAFQQYMIMAWAVWPALAIAWWFTVSSSKIRRLLDLVIAGAISAFASVLWILAVWATPQSERPYIGNTLHNNPWEMVFGYNALGRFGNSGQMAGQRNSGSLTFKTFTPPFSGHPSLIRLFYHQVIGQISWLIPATIVALIYLAIQGRRKQYVLAFGVWFGTSLVMFSAVSGMHQYYTATLAIPMSLLVAVASYDAYVAKHRWWLIGQTLATAGMAILVAALNPTYLPVLPWIQVALAIALAAYATAGIAGIRPDSGGYRKAGAVLMVGALVFSPMVWALDSMNHPSFVNPMAGPPDTYTTKLAHHSGQNRVLNGGDDTGNSASRGAGAKSTAISHAKVLNWIQTRPHGKYSLVTFGADAAAPYVILKRTISRHIDVLPIGGFNGTDPVPTLDEFKKLVREHQVNYVLMDKFLGDEKAYGSLESARIKKWVAANCRKNETPPDKVTLFYCWAR